MKKFYQNIIFLLLGFIFILIAIFPTVYFHVFFLDKRNSDAYYYFRYNTFYILILFTFIFSFLSFIFIIPGMNLFLRSKLKKPFSYKRSFYILIFASLFEFFIMSFLFPQAVITLPPPN